MCGRHKITSMKATRTYLQLTTPGQFRSAFGPFPELAIERVAHPTPKLYRECYRTVGEAYHWRDRWDWTDAEIQAHLAQPEIILYVARWRGGTSCDASPRTTRWRSPTSDSHRTRSASASASICSRAPCATPGHSVPRACGSIPARSTTPTRCPTTRSAGSRHTRRSTTRQITEWACFRVDSPA